MDFKTRKSGIDDYTKREFAGGAIVQNYTKRLIMHETR